MKRLAAVLLLLLFAGPLPAQVTLTQGTNFSVDAAPDGRLAIDLLGTLWILPPNGGPAEAIAANALPIRRPQWSPTAESIIYQAKSDQQEQIWCYRFSDNSAINIGGVEFSNQYPSWHPSGERIVFVSDRRDSGYDLWELDLATSLSWRVSHTDGDELEPAWSANGRDLVYVHHRAGTWSIMLRRLGEPDRSLVSSQSRLSSPQWRPDGSLITFLRHHDDSLSIDMIILSQPPLIRPLISGEDFFVAPVTWLDREQFVYAANGVIRKRSFNSWSSSNIPFRATVGSTGAGATTTLLQRDLPIIDIAPGQLVLRTARLFDGIGGGYRNDIDVVIKDGKIAALEARRERPGEIIVDLGNVTALPGFIDSFAALPANTDAAMGALLLSFGVTTIVTEHAAAEVLNQTWSGKETPGPRVLAVGKIATADPNPPLPWLLTIGGDLDNGIQHRDTVAAWMTRSVPVLASSWQVALGSGASMLLGADALPTSPGGYRYADSNLGRGAAAITVVSGLADLNTPGLDNLLHSRQAKLLPAPLALRRLKERHALRISASTVILGSRPNGLPPGMAVHAEFLALAAAGLSGEQILRSAGVNAASALGMGLQAGRLAPGSVADLVIVDGDPLQRANDLARVVGVVRNGRFFSAIGLIERAQAASGVE